MKQLFSIYWKDIKSIMTNYAALIVVLALCILPSLYAWFNIKASWDPYGQESTSGIKVAVVNQDAGATLKEKNVCIGDEVVEELKKNRQLGWQFLTREEAMTALKKEKIYAVITIPKDFSRSLVSIVSDNITKGEIIYTVNEKMNAIAPKLTDKGVTSLQNMISQSVVETVSNVIFETANEIGVNLEKQIPNLTKAYDELQTIQSKFPDINRTIEQSDTGVAKLKTLLKEVNQNLPQVTTTIKDCKELVYEITEFVNTSQNTVNQVAPVIIQDMQVLSSVAKETNVSLKALKTAIEGNIEAAPEILVQMQSKVETMKTMTNGMLSLLEKLNSLSKQKPLQTYISRLAKVAEYLEASEQVLALIQSQIQTDDGVSLDKLDQLIKTSESVSTILNTLQTELGNTMVPSLNAIFDDANKTAEEVIGVLNSAQAKLPEVKEILHIATNSIDKGKKGIAYAKKVLPKAEKLINGFVTKLEIVNNEGGLKEIVSLLKADVTARSDFLSNPVTITEEKLYPMGNYGTSMTPFYTVLSLWVGILLLVSMLSVDSYGDYKTYQVYFAKFLLFGTITLIQALIVSLGDLYLLKIYCKNEALFLAGNLFTSLVFMAIVYSFVSVFGNVGKVIGIILLVLQVAGSGGTFPIQLTPKFFQILNPYLPFTYCISFNREAIGGVVEEVIWKDCLVMLGLIGGSILMALLLKKPINQLLKKFKVKFHESGIGEH